MAASGEAGSKPSGFQMAKLALVNPRGRNRFISQLPDKACVLDVGCGHDSPRTFKSLRSDLTYVGLDVGDCRQPVDPRSVADEYVVVESHDFRDAITRFGPRFDGIVSAHNLEHCEDQSGVVKAMANALVPGGQLFVAFPAAASTKFPSRAGCLNFFDDETHSQVPDFELVCRLLKEEGLEIEYQAARYRPAIKFMLGLGVEPISALRKSVMPGTWALYGFEGIIWARKPK